MPIYRSPGVYTLEKDLSNLIAPLPSSSAALVGYSAKGDVDNVVLITSPQQFIEEYGKPDPSSGHYFHYAALDYFRGGSQLYCLRVTNGALYGGAYIMASSSSEENQGFSTGLGGKDLVIPSGMETDVLFQVTGTNPGVWNNRVAVTVTDINDGSAEEVSDRYTFTLSVYYQDDDGVWSEVESFIVSRQKKLSGTGKQLYLETRINGISKYIWVTDNTDIVDTVLPKEQQNRLTLTGGDNGLSVSPSHIVNGWDSFADREKIVVGLLINGGETDVSVQTKMKEIAESRKDCIALLDVPYDSCFSTSDILHFRNEIQNFNSSYCALYAPWVTIRDSFNDLLIDVPPSGCVAGAIANSDRVGNVWDAPAGEERGVLDVLNVSPIIFSQADRDALYSAGVNPIQKFHGRGIFIYGQKTLQKKNSALNRINVRRLVNAIKQDCSEALRAFILGPNTNSEITRFRVRATLEQYFDLLSARGAFQLEGGDKGYRVVCDEMNNTPEVIDNNELHVDIFIKPARTVEFIQLQAIITTTGASFQELISRGLLY